MDSEHGVDAQPPAERRLAFHKGLALAAGSLIAVLILSDGLGYWNTLQLHGTIPWSRTPTRYWMPSKASFPR